LFERSCPHVSGDSVLPALEGDDSVLVRLIRHRPVPGADARRDFSPKVPKQKEEGNQ
jgi:hypothetical protein